MTRRCIQQVVDVAAQLRCIRANLVGERTDSYEDSVQNDSYLGLSMTAIVGPCQALGICLLDRRMRLK